MNGQQNIVQSIPDEFDIVPISEPPPAHNPSAKGQGRWQRLIDKLRAEHRGQWVLILTETSDSTVSTAHGLKNRYEGVEVTSRTHGKAKIDGKTVRSFDIYMRVN